MVPLKCLAKAGADMTRLQTVFELSVTGPIDISLSRIEVGTVADEIVPC